MRNDGRRKLEKISTRNAQCGFTVMDARCPVVVAQ
jgi:hypothetical protein